MIWYNKSIGIVRKKGVNMIYGINSELVGEYLVSAELVKKGEEIHCECSICGEHIEYSENPAIYCPTCHSQIVFSKECKIYYADRDKVYQSFLSAIPYHMKDDFEMWYQGDHMFV